MPGHCNWKECVFLGYSFLGDAFIFGILKLSTPQHVPHLVSLIDDYFLGSVFGEEPLQHPYMYTE